MVFTEIAASIAAAMTETAIGSIALLCLNMDWRLDCQAYFRFVYKTHFFKEFPPCFSRRPKP